MFEQQEPVAPFRQNPPDTLKGWRLSVDLSRYGSREIDHPQKEDTAGHRQEDPLPGMVSQHDLSQDGAEDEAKTRRDLMEGVGLAVISRHQPVGEGRDGRGQIDPGREPH